MPGCGLTEPGGGAASGEEERLPGRLYSFPPVGGNEVLFLSRKKERSNRNSESCRRPAAAREKTRGQGNTAAAKNRMHRRNERKIQSKRSMRHKQLNEDMKERED